MSEEKEVELPPLVVTDAERDDAMRIGVEAIYPTLTANDKDWYVSHPGAIGRKDMIALQWLVERLCRERQLRASLAREAALTTQRNEAMDQESLFGQHRHEAVVECERLQGEVAALTKQVEELQGHCARAGVGGYVGNYFLGELTLLGRLNAAEQELRQNSIDASWARTNRPKLVDCEDALQKAEAELVALREGATVSYRVDEQEKSGRWDTSASPYEYDGRHRRNEAEAMTQSERDELNQRAIRYADSSMDSVGLIMRGDLLEQPKINNLKLNNMLRDAYIEGSQERFVQVLDLLQQLGTKACEISGLEAVVKSSEAENQRMRELLTRAYGHLSCDCEVEKEVESFLAEHP